MSDLGEQLAAVRDQDPARGEDPVIAGCPHHHIFGASKHRYVSHRLDEREIAGFETLIGVALPVGFRRFLLEVGWGAGPYYGILSPEECITETEGLACGNNGHAVVGCPSDEFPLTQEDAVRIRRLLDDGEHLEGSATYPRGGFLCVALHGCAGYCAIALTGPGAGTMWDFWYGVGAYPATRPPGRLISRNEHAPLPALHVGATFEEWYASWLECCLLHLGRVSKAT